ncbi:hypothetical protein LMG29542_05547 [Paraburkholderia humisilvae]|uniref:Nickel/cobalt homeostasis protein RcnB n=2 Tax=Paraburkholderia humisilvae TaxID=627669 RepID=A0A6J5EL03_9BURK|nr:hypothetical protein LMG29542_05547 [Paraburkholderia humisilvae]
MKSQRILSVIAALLVGVTSAALAQGNDEQSQGMGRQQVMPTIPHRDWHKGQQVPREYRDHNFMLDNWKDHKLTAPPRGQQWLGVNGDYVLVNRNNWKVVKVVGATD